MSKVRKITAKPEFNVAQEVVQDLLAKPFTIAVFHPVIVVDADLWGVTSDDLVALDHARVHLTGVSRSPYFWFDIVQRKAVANYISATQAEYDRQAREKGFTYDEPDEGILDYDIAHP